MDETYTTVKGRWMHRYRAVDKHGKTLDFILSKRRDETAATAFFKQTIENNGVPEKVVIDKSGANRAGLENINVLFLLLGFWRFFENITRPIKGVKSFHSAAATVQGIEGAHMIKKKKPFHQDNLSAFQQFARLAG